MRLPDHAAFAAAKQVISPEQIDARVRDLGRQISTDYADRDLHIVGVLDSSFVFVSDLIRAISAPSRCGFLRPDLTQVGPTTEIFFSPALELKGADVIIVRGVLHSGVTTDFVARTLIGYGAASVKICTLLDRPSAHKIALHPDYLGFVVDESYFVGYGLADKDGFGRNLPGIFALPHNTRP